MSVRFNKLKLMHTELEAKHRFINKVAVRLNKQLQANITKGEGRVMKPKGQARVKTKRQSEEPTKPEDKDERGNETQSIEVKIRATVRNHKEETVSKDTEWQ